MTISSTLKYLNTHLSRISLSSSSDSTHSTSSSSSSNSMSSSSMQSISMNGSHRYAHLQGTEQAARARLTQIGPPLKANQTLKKSDLQPGDILFYVKQPDNYLPVDVAIAAGHRLAQKKQPQNNQGPTDIIHALIWTKSPNNPGNAVAQGPGEPEIVEAHVDLTAKKRHAVIGTALTKGHYLVFRPKDKNLGDWAAQIAMVWGSERKIPYSIPKAAKEGVRSILKKEGPVFDDAAKNRALDYMEQAFNSNPDWKKKGAFCSHIVLAAYQAAFLNIEKTNGYLGDSEENPTVAESRIDQYPELHLDAKQSTPLNLHNFLLKGNSFEQVGKIEINKSDVLYTKA